MPPNRKTCALASDRHEFESAAALAGQALLP
jgi:hypothetical protein